MVIKSFSKKMDVNEAQKLAKKKGNFIGKILLKNHDEINMKELYIENKIITFSITFTPFAFIRRIFKNYKEKKMQIKVIANGSTGGVAYYDENEINIETTEVKKDDLQLSDHDIEKLITKGNILIRRILRRRIGGNLKMEVVDVQSVFRPYHVAFFGELIEGRKVRYMPIPADGCKVKKTF
ncbi:hypothetical protein [Maledivibacter halophilus]|uniref:Uncharacterized protein n=1 Tax=Maledivibacter halophilus TaxID=36842 RepID=A0A1T5LKH7_9FIRM|nr:hypothetical protein [Maledivibacter halophilus]SKC76497.1 hypothetical protein SAMN02194393_02994 [Maledivibacter halophilus]